MSLGPAEEPNMTAELLRRLTRRSEKVAEAVAHEIVRDAVGLPVGSKLPGEIAMMEKYNVSRASLREALRILEVQGLIVIRPGPGGGPVMLGPASDSLGRTETLFFHLLNATYGDLLEAMLALEPAAARLAARRPGKAHVDGLRRSLDDLDDTTEVARFRSSASDFHTRLLHASGNPVLALTVQSLREILLSRIAPIEFDTERERRRISDAHMQTVEAIAKGDAERAERTMADHIALFGARVRRDEASLLRETIDWH